MDQYSANSCNCFKIIWKVKSKNFMVFVFLVYTNVPYVGSIFFLKVNYSRTEFWWEVRIWNPRHRELLTAESLLLGASGFFLRVSMEFLLKVASCVYKILPKQSCKQLSCLKLMIKAEMLLDLQLFLSLHVRRHSGVVIFKIW